MNKGTILLDLVIRMESEIDDDIKLYGKAKEMAKKNLRESLKVFGLDYEPEDDVLGDICNKMSKKEHELEVITDIRNYIEKQLYRNNMLDKEHYNL